jgi:hypothetical protein
MRRLPPLALVCALLCLAVGTGPALAAQSHHHSHPATTATTMSSTAGGGADPVGGKATTKDGLTVLNDCSSHGQLTRTYPVAWLRKALSMMSADASEYSNCSTVLHQAIVHDVRPTSGSSGGSSATTIVIIVAIVLVLLAALLGGLALRRRGGGGGGGGAGGGPTSA